MATLEPSPLAPRRVPNGRCARSGRRCAAGPTVGLLLFAVLALSWVWDGPGGAATRRAAPLRAPEVAVGSAHAEAGAGDLSLAVRPEAAARMAAHASGRKVDAVPSGSDAHALRPDALAADEQGSSGQVVAGLPAVGPSVSLNASGSAESAAAAASGAKLASSEDDPEECRSNLVVVLTSHKTGTAQAG